MSRRARSATNPGSTWNFSRPSQRALGLPRVDDPDAQVHLRADAEAAARSRVFIDVGFTREQVIAVSRVMAQGLAHTAEVMRQAVLEVVLQPGATELQLAQAYEAMVRHVSPLVGPMAENALRSAVAPLPRDRGGQRHRAGRRHPPGRTHVAVAFADLVGFTRLGEAVPPEALENLANRLSDLARDVAVPPVRFIKTIGDAVMFVSTDPVALLRAALALLTAAEKYEDLPQLRIGIASGLAVRRAGDWFGSPVNIASRVTGVARPGAVLVSESARDAIGSADGFAWSFAGDRHLKGVKGDVNLFRVQRSNGD